MLNKIFIFFIISILLSNCTRKVVSSPMVTADRNKTKVISISTMNADIINEVNAYRKNKGLPPMRLLTIAVIEAARHSQNMAEKKINFGHTGFKQRAISIANELKGTSSTGENIAFGKMSYKEVVAAWLKSTQHRANIEGMFNYTGVGTAKDSKGVVYYTQLFIKK